MTEEPKSFHRDILPPETTVMGEELTLAYQHWESLNGRDSIPTWQDFDLRSLGDGVMQWCTLVDVRRNPLMFTYRYYGKEYVRYQGRDYTGKSVADLKRRIVAKKIFEELRMVTDMAMPMLFETTSPEDPLVNYRHLRLPFGTGQDVTEILSVGVYNRDAVSVLQKFFNLLD